MCAHGERPARTPLCAGSPDRRPSATCAPAGRAPHRAARRGLAAEAVGERAGDEAGAGRAQLGALDDVQVVDLRGHVLHAQLVGREEPVARPLAALVCSRWQR